MAEGSVTAAALLFAVLILGVVAFQVALALGAPWGACAMGGAFSDRYPPAMRVAALVQAAILLLAAAIVLDSAGLVDLPVLGELAWLIWVVVALTAVGVVLNAISRSAGERRIWLPVTAVLFASSLVVALG